MSQQQGLLLNLLAFGASFLLFIISLRTRPSIPASPEPPQPSSSLVRGSSGKVASTTASTFAQLSAQAMDGKTSSGASTKPWRVAGWIGALIGKTVGKPAILPKPPLPRK